jgi:hypothetical protein
VRPAALGAGNCSGWLNAAAPSQVESRAHGHLGRLQIDVPRVAPIPEHHAQELFYFAPDLLSERFDRFFSAPFPSPAREAENGKSPRCFPEIAHLTDLWPAPMVRGSYGAYWTHQPEPDQRGRQPGGFTNLLLYAQAQPAGVFHDVTSGNNDIYNDPDGKFAAGRGWTRTPGWAQSTT